MPAVRRYYDPLEQTFPAKQIAKEAFLAGNDVLILSQFDLKNRWPDQVLNIKTTIDFFASEYRANPAFRQRVDEAVARILRAKLRLYGDFSPATVKVPVDRLDGMLRTEEAQALVSRIAQAAITLVHPRAEVLRDRLPAGPRRGDTIVIFTDDTLFQDCFEKIPECAPAPMLDTTAMTNAILRLYGPRGEGQILPEQIHSLTFSQLRAFLAAPFEESTEETSPSPEATPTLTPTPAPDYISEPEADVDVLLSQADWIIFAMLDMNTQRFEAADAVRVFLDVGPRSYDKRIVTIALNAPYRLDSTEISKLSAYYATYSKTPAFVEAAVRALFGDLSPPGASPVSIEGVGYDLTERLAPDPGRDVPIVIIEPDNPSQVTDFPTTVRVQTDQVLDHNGNVVPDGTQVTFIFERDNGEALAQVTAGTVNGVAETQLEVAIGGPLFVRAISVQASSGPPVRVDFRPPTPTSTPTATSSPTETPSATPASTPATVRGQGDKGTRGQGDPSPCPLVSPSPCLLGRSQRNRVPGQRN